MDSEKNIILLVFEGEKTEKLIASNLTKFYLNEDNNTIVYGLYCNVIYDLYDAMHDNEGELIYDIFPILKNKSQNKAILQDIKERKSISEIYLFFDYDGQSHLADIEKLKKMLNHFNNETEYGKLYISYPMVESLKHLSSKINCTELTCCVTEKKYKSIVNGVADNKYKQINKYTQKIWEEVIDEHSKRLGYLYKDVFEPLNTEIPQKEIFDLQYTKYIQSQGKVYILGSFPILLLDYYGYAYFGYK